MAKDAQKFRNLIYLADRSGTGQWRRIFETQCINCLASQLGLDVDFTQYPILDPGYYKGMNSVTVQRWTSDNNLKIFTEFLKPVSGNHMFFLIYEIDDCMSDTVIPLYNRGREGFTTAKIQANIRIMLNLADFVTVTTKRLKTFYHKEFNVPLENIIVIPNTLPRWWIDGLYDLDKSVSLFNKNKQKPRVGIISSISHYNVLNLRQTLDGQAAVPTTNGSTIEYTVDGKTVNVSDTIEVKDDLSEMIPLIKETLNDIQWVLLGYCPPELEEFVKTKQLELHNVSPILNYPMTISKLALQAIVAPLIDNEFNRCKSPIKFLEAAAIGVPLYAQDCPPYSDYMDSKFLFKTSSELKNMLLKLKSTSSTVYRSMVETNYTWLNSPHSDGDFRLVNYWMEDNLGIWINLFKLKQNTLNISLNKFVKQYSELKKEEIKDILFKTPNGAEITQ